MTTDTATYEPLRRARRNVAKRVLLDRVKDAYRRREQANARYRQAVVNARNGGCSLGVVAETVGTDRASISRLERRHRESL